MADRTPLSATDATRRVSAELPDWTMTEDARAIRRAFRFKDFSQAFAFMARVAMIAERLDHHPEWTNVYNKLDITLTTHDTGGLSALDLEMAGLIDRLLQT